VESGLEFADAVETNDGGAVDAGEIGGAEAFFDGGERFANDETRGVGEVKEDVVVGGFDPDDFLRFEEDDATFGFEGEAGGFLGGCGVGEQGFEAAAEVAGAALADMFGGAGEGDFEAVAVEGFQEIVDGIDAEGIDGEAIVGGGEDDGGALLGGEFLNDLEAVGAGHLDVEEDDVGCVVFDGGEGFGAAAAFTDDFDGGVAAQKRAEAFASEGFVVDDEEAELGHGEKKLRQPRIDTKEDELRSVETDSCSFVFICWS